MTDTHVEVENKKPDDYSKLKIPIVTRPIYRKIFGRSVAAPYLVAQVIYWAAWATGEGLEEFYKSDQEFADELCVSLRASQRAKSLLKKLRIISTRVAVKKNGDNTTYYTFNSARLEELIVQVESGIDVVPTRHLDGLLNKSATRHLDGDQPATWARPYIDTEITTEITKINTCVFTKNELPPNQSGLGNLPYDQKPMGVETDLLGKEEIIPEKTPTPKNEQSIQLEKAVEPPLPTLKADDVEKSKKFKGKGKNKKQGSMTEEQKAQFGQLWNIWPKKFKKKAAKKYFAQALEAGIEFSVLLSQGAAHIQYEKEKNGHTDYVLYLRTWLKEEGWDDEYPTSAKSSSQQNGAAAAKEELPVDERFKDFVATIPSYKKFYFEGAVFHEIRGDILNIIQSHGDWKKNKIEDDVDELKSWFKVRYVRAYAKVSDVPQPSKPNLLQASVNSGESNELDRVLQDIGKGIKGQERGMKIAVSNPEKSTPISNTVQKPSYNSVKPMQDSEIGGKQIGSGKI